MNAPQSGTEHWAFVCAQPRPSPEPHTGPPPRRPRPRSQGPGGRVFILEQALKGLLSGTQGAWAPYRPFSAAPLGKVGRPASGGEPAPRPSMWIKQFKEKTPRTCLNRGNRLLGLDPAWAGGRVQEGWGQVSTCSQCHGEDPRRSWPDGPLRCRWTQARQVVAGGGGAGVVSLVTKGSVSQGGAWARSCGERGAKGQAINCSMATDSSLPAPTPLCKETPSSLPRPTGDGVTLSFLPERGSSPPPESRLDT